MLNQTTETAIKILIYLTLNQVEYPVAPKSLGEALHESPSYIAKIMGALAKAGIVRTQRGAGGGVTLIQEPGKITLLEIVEACQGKILGDFCRQADRLDQTCAFHQSMYQVYKAVTGILQQWTVSDLAKKPFFSSGEIKNVSCRMTGICTHVNKQ